MDSESRLEKLRELFAFDGGATVDRIIQAIGTPGNDDIAPALIVELQQAPKVAVEYLQCVMAARPHDCRPRSRVAR